MLGICDHSRGMDPLIWTKEEVVMLPCLSSSTTTCSLSTKFATAPYSTGAWIAKEMMWNMPELPYVHQTCMPM